MPGIDADFAAYVAARWSFLVRSLVLLGCSPDEAVDVARSGLARCHASWEGVRRAGDVDVHVYRTVLGSWHRSRRRRWWGEAPRETPAEVAPPEEASDLARLHAALAAELSRLSPERREVLVLRFVADLTEPQIADVLDVPISTVRGRVAVALGEIDLVALEESSTSDVVTEEKAAEIFHEASEAIEAMPPPAEEVVTEAGAQRRRRRRTVLAGVSAAVIAVGALTWVADREAESSDGRWPATVTREINPVGVAWYADGTLHLAKVSVQVRALTDLVGLDGGVVYGDDEGTVAFVAGDGDRRRIGHKDPHHPLVASTAEGWAVWVDPGDGEGHARLVLYGVGQKGQLAESELPSADVRPVAIDQHRVYYETPDGIYAWIPDTDAHELLPRGGLLDVDAATRVYQDDQRIEMVQSFFSVSYPRPGIGARLSVGGSFVLSKAPEPGLTDGRPFRPLLYDARSGDRAPSGLGPGERAVDATFGQDQTVVYLVAQVADLAGGSDLDGNFDPLLLLRTCDYAAARCSDVALVQPGDGRPLLAQ